MDALIQALERSRSNPSAAKTSEHREARKPAAVASVSLDAALMQQGKVERPAQDALKNRRVVAFDPQDPQTRTFDVLRNRVLGELPTTGSHVVAVVAPTAGCGVSVTAANLAFSIARVHGFTAMLADMNVPSRLSEQLALDRSGIGLDANAGFTRIEAGGGSVLASPAGELLRSFRQQASQPALVSSWLSQVKREFEPAILVLDLPPLLQDDDAMPIAVNADSIVLVFGVGKSTIADLEACRSSLPESRCHIVLNKTRRHGL